MFQLLGLFHRDREQASHAMLWQLGPSPGSVLQYRDLLPVVPEVCSPTDFPGNL